MGRILFDLSVCQPNGSGKYHGGGVYGIIVFKALAELYHSYISVYLDVNKFISEEALNIIKKYNIKKYDSSIFTLKDVVVKEEFSILYSPLFKTEYLAIKDIPILLTIHGLRALEMNRDKYEYLYSRSIWSFLKSFLKHINFIYYYLHKRYLTQYSFIEKNNNIDIVTVSEHSKYSILSFYANVGKDIEVYYSPSTCCLDISTIQPYANYKYYLLVSANRWLKNSYRAILALDQLFSEGKINASVIVLGLKKNSFIMSKIKNKSHFVLLEYVDNNVLESLYKGAYALIYPTLNEGFGYPPLEAMKYGTPVLSSPFSAITEICGDSLIYFNPYSIHEIKNRLLYLDNKDVMNDYSLRVIEKYEKIAKRQAEDLDKLVNKIVSYLL